LRGMSCAFADDALDRENIIIYAISRSFALNGGHVFEKMVYVGDSLWDLRAASNLKLSFTGIRGSGRGGLLKKVLNSRFFKTFVTMKDSSKFCILLKCPSARWTD
jgi:hypothetical protein